MSGKDSKRQDPRRQPKQERSVETVRIILDAAQNVVLRDGLGSATAASIAKEAGISIGSLYQYFPTKDAILAAWEERIWQQELMMLAGMAIGFNEITYPMEKSIYEIVRAAIDAVSRQVLRYGALTAIEELVSRVGQRVQYMDMAATQIASLLDNAADRNMIHAKTFAELELMCVIVVKTTMFLSFTGATQHRAEMENGVWQHQVSAMMTRYMVGDAKSPARPPTMPPPGVAAT